MELNQNHTKNPLSESRFWEIIALFDWEKGDDDNSPRPHSQYLLKNFPCFSIPP
ncbi:hypothetical protein Halhy_5310 [Haliscomenobacter hydrossis DSM 1100]|uniref:Uncharacterized protein n=1 Tax=Haliscomenobacter hydrossis (strain ATCC 27775 / DSM 1100 / LMG 10767 / O) TaxID=760192 RepID=F4L7A8_HALH1|nr:hypothetical protein Halhy_5310 [Haliscomenobacter hydrossis DSM 1100]